MKLKTITTGGHKVDIYVNEDGEFTAQAAGQYLRNINLGTLVGAVQRLMKKPTKKVELKYSLLHGSEVRQIVLTGVHASRGEALGYVEGSPKAKVTIDRGYNREVLQRLKPEQVSEWARLYRAEAEAARKLAEFKDRFMVKNVAAEVQAAVDEALAEEAGPASEDPRL